MLTLEALLVLDAIDRKGSFAAAAAELHKVPSALSYTVKQLEAHLQLTLFDRSAQKAVMTQAGRMVLKQGRELLQGAEQLTQQARQVATGWEPSLRIAVESILPMSPLWPLLAKLGTLNATTTIEVREEALSGSWEALSDGRVDLIIGASEVEPAGLKVEKTLLGSISFQLVCAAHHELAAIERDQVTEVDLKKYAQVVLRDSASHFAPRSVGLYRVRRQLLVDHHYAKEEAILAGMGFGFLPKSRIGQHMAAGRLVALSAVKPEYQVPIYLARLAAHSGKGVDWLIDAIVKEGSFKPFLASD